MDKDPTRSEQPPAIVVKKPATTVMSPLTNASVASSKGTAKSGNDPSKTPPRLSSARTTTKNAVRRSDRLTNSARKRQKTSRGKKKPVSKKIAATNDGEEERDEDSDYEEDALSIDEEEELPIDDTVEMDDVDDARMVADVDQASQSKQINLKKKSIKFEKQHVVLTVRSGRKISATAFAKGYFKMASLTVAGEKLMDSKDGMLWILPFFFDACVPCLYLTSLVHPSVLNLIVNFSKKVSFLVMILFLL